MASNPILTHILKRRAEIRQQLEALQAEDAELTQAEAVIRRFSEVGPVIHRSRIRMSLPPEEPAPLKNQEAKVLEVIMNWPHTGVSAEHINEEIARRYGTEIKTNSLHAVLSKLRSAGKITKKEDGLWCIMDS